MTEPPTKPSPVEDIKLASNYLRGSVPQELVDAGDSFTKPMTNVLKFHGTYQQDDREARVARPEGGKRRSRTCFMVRTKIPGGKLTSEQLLAELDLCDEVGNTTLRITSRQGLQLHGVLEGQPQAGDRADQRDAALDARRPAAT